MVQQIVSFEELFDSIKEEGIYLGEDLHTSYWMNYGGGYKRKSSFIEYSKNFIDSLHAYHSRQRALRVNNFTDSVDSIHYYDSIIVIEKKKRIEPPHAEKTGTASFETEFTGEYDGNAIQEFLYKFKITMSNFMYSLFRIFR